MFGLPGGSELMFGIVILLIYILSCALIIILFIRVNKTIYLCNPKIRTIEPEQVWYLFIPIFNLVWYFVVIIRVSDSIKAEYKMRNIILHRELSKLYGLAIPIFVSLALFKEFFISFSLVFGILYWAKISEYYRELSHIE